MSQHQTVLIVEDDAFLLKAYEHSFDQTLYDVTYAHDGEEALVLMKNTVPDLVILDLVTPKKSGLEVMKAMRSDPRLEHVKVIVATNIASEKDEKACTQLGALRYMVKTNHSLQEIVVTAQQVLLEK